MKQQQFFLLLLSFLSLHAIAQIQCDTIASFRVAETRPTGITWDGEYLWTCGTNLPYIYKYDTIGTLVDSIITPSSSNGIQDLAFDGLGLWVLVDQVDSIYQLDTSSGLIINQFHIPLYANGSGLTFKDSNLYISIYTDSLIIKVNPINGNAIDTIKTMEPIYGLTGINGLLFGLSLFQNVSGQLSSNLYEIEETSGLLVDSTSWCIPFPIGLTWDGNDLWNISSSISVGGRQKAYKTNIFQLPVSNKVIDRLNKFEFDVSPNPLEGSGTIHIRANRNGYANIELFNSKGRKVRTISNSINLNEDKSISINVESLPAGIYFVKLSGQNDNVVRKILIR